MYSVTFLVNCLPNKVTSGQTFNLFCLCYLSTVHLVTKQQWTWICQSTCYKSSWAVVNKIRATYLAGEKLAGENADWPGLLVTDVCLLLMAVSGVVCGLLIEPFEEDNNIIITTFVYHMSALFKQIAWPCQQLPFLNGLMCI